MTELTAVVMEQTTMYFAQRRPRELSQFKWVKNAKDPRRITPQEKWWRDTLGPLQESRFRRKPFERVDDPDFDYRFFDKSCEIKKRMWYPDKPCEIITGYDIRKILSDQISFKVSHSDILLQATDILTNFLRRVLMGRIVNPAVAYILGRLQIRQRVDTNFYQSIHLHTFTDAKQAKNRQLERMIEQMSLAGRSMLRR
jgi:hypothetical protein